MKKKSMLCAVLALLFLLTGCRGRNTASAEQVHIKDYQGIPAYTQPTLSQSGSGSTAASTSPARQNAVMRANWKIYFTQ